MLTDVKLALRITSLDFDDEINGLIEACEQDLLSVGVRQAAIDSDPLVKRAVITYCKAFFGWDNPDADRLQASYATQKENLMRKKDYSD